VVVWERSFVAMSVLLGESPEEAIEHVRGDQAAMAELVKRLRDPRRAARAQALAVALHDVAKALRDAVLA
jgi:hypothetical protein